MASETVKTPETVETVETHAPLVHVFLPATLAERTHQQQRVAVSGATVRDLIAALDEQFPGIRFNLCLETGELRPFVNIFVNGKHIRYLHGLETLVTAETTVHIFPSVAGG